MLQTIYCYNCDNGNNLSFSIDFTYRIRNCNGCHHTSFDKWTYHFCNVNCFFEWADEHHVRERGIPCQSCSNSGQHPSGFDLNGPCPSCNGERYVQATDSNIGEPNV